MEQYAKRSNWKSEASFERQFRPLWCCDRGFLKNQAIRSERRYSKFLVKNEIKNLTT